MADSPTSTKPGYKSTEFWLSTAAVVVSAILASGAVTSQFGLQVLTIVSTILGSLGYTVARSYVKGNDAKARAFEAAGKAVDKVDPT